MRDQTGLQAGINAQYERLADTDAETIDHQVALIRDWISGQPELRAILAAARVVELDLDFEAWRANMTDGEKAFVWPSRTEAGRAWLVWRLGHFLDTCYRAGLLRIAGAGYQFRHRELQDYLARNPVP